jgi:D-alanine-D-alanine ligase
LRVTVLCGGPSAERAVSLQSGRAVADALCRRGHDVFVADIGWDQLEALDQPADVVFPALHGTFGEDGTVQRMLEERHIPFVGADSRASAVAIDKVASKTRVREIGLETPAFEVWNGATLQSPSGSAGHLQSPSGSAGPQRSPSGSAGHLQSPSGSAGPVFPARTAPDVPWPVVVKPIDQGSSVATTIVRARDAFLPCVRDVVAGFGKALVEQFIDGDEITVGIVGDQTLPPICVRPKREFYDYQAKYVDDATEYLFDAQPAPLLAESQRLSRRVFECLGCRHLARVDWIAGRDGRLWFLELNTLPGFTSHSLVPKAAARAGISFDELVERLVFMAYGAGPSPGRYAPGGGPPGSVGDGR